MRVFLYEWVTGGGLVEQSGSLPQSLLVEGATMLAALAADFNAIDDTQVVVLKDIRLDDLPLPACEVVEIHSDSHHREEFEQLAAEADHTLVIAPETDNVLHRTHGMARSAGARLLAPDEAFVRLTSDKHAMALHFERTGVPVPESILLDADQEKLPSDFVYPGVVKPVYGAGSQNTLLVSSARDEPPPYPWPRRLERYYAGTSASVSFLCGPAHRTALPACRQHLTTDGRFSYTGGALLQDEELTKRATTLAAQALDALPAALGYVGVDLVLGKAADGSEDVVIEVNPRMTTSYVGLRAATNDNLAAAMIENAAGRIVSPTFSKEPLDFLADGTIRNSGGLQ